MVDHNRVVADRSCLRVAPVARNVGMAPCKRKRSALIVIERRWRPENRVVTFRAPRLVILHELPGVNVGVAILAQLRRSFERYFTNSGGRLVARTARDRAMSADQRKLRFQVIETFCVDP